MIYERLVLMRDLLAEDGSIYVHCDWHANHFIRCMLDEVFGRNSFVNEIIWYYYNKLSPSSLRYLIDHHRRGCADVLAGRLEGCRVHTLILRAHISIEHQRWSRLSEQIFRFDKWSVCRG